MPPRTSRTYKGPLRAGAVGRFAGCTPASIPTESAEPATPAPVHHTTHVLPSSGTGPASQALYSSFSKSCF